MSEHDYAATDIAVIGFAGRFPGAPDVETFWENLKAGVESITRLNEQDLRESGVSESRIADPSYVPALAQLDDADCFDAEFFGFTPREAAVMDPQHRHFLECAWKALENGGYDPARYAGRIGVYGGVARNTYLLHILSRDPDFLDRIGDWEGLIGGERDFLATRVAYKLGLKGPAINVQTACSTSAVAIHLACQSLLSGECDIALAGGGRVQAPLDQGYLFEEGGIFAADGHCRAFDAKAGGTLRGSGVAIVALKRLADAVADGDTVHAVVKGTAVNNDGVDKVGFTAPSVRGQSDVIAEALTVADVSPDSIGYVETHGTGTAVGDPIEVAALTRAYRTGTNRTGYCPIGSVKSNIGHLDAGAGVTGFLKCVLSLREGLIPPSLHFETPNPQIDFEHSPFFVNAELREWRRGALPRRAGVSSFGLGGTNAHIILEEAPELEPSGESRPYQLLTLSARTSAALGRVSEDLARYLDEPSATLADIAYTLHVGRRRMSERGVAICESPEDGAAALRDATRVVSRSTEQDASGVVFMFPGQGAQHVNMGLGLYRTETIFRDAIDRCATLLEPHLGFDLKTMLYPESGGEDAATERLKETEVTQPAVFTLEYALAELWRSWGIEPVAMIGHSIGEYTAACLAGVFDLDAALRLVCARGRLMEVTPPGAMASVPLPEEEVVGLLGSDLALAGLNAPGFCVVSGSEAAVEDLMRRMAREGHECTRLHVTRAFHSPLMDQAVQPFADEIRRAQPREPNIPFASNVTGDWITTHQATDPEYWARHIRQPVRFATGLGRILEDRPGVLLLEVGPGKTLSSLSRMNPAADRASAIVPTLGHPKDTTPDEVKALTALGKLWTAGIEVDWDGFHAGERRRRVPLPTYPFERRRHWIETNPRVRQESSAAVITSGTVDSSETAVAEEASLGPEERLRSRVAEILHGLSGIEPSALDFNATFLELGFESLSLTQVSRAVKREFGLGVGLRELMNNCQTPEALVDLIASETGSVDETVDATPADERTDQEAAPEVPSAAVLPEVPTESVELPLTQGQMEIWLAAALRDDANCAFNLANTLRLHGPLDLTTLRESIQRIVRRHEALRITIAADGSAQRVVSPAAVDASLEVLDLSGRDANARAKELDAARRAEVETPFDLERGPLFRTRLIRLDEEDHLLFLTVHHIAVDGWSCGVLLRNIAEVYSALVEKRIPQLPAVTQFAEYVRNERAWRESGETARDEEYWLAQFADGAPDLDLPTDRARPAARTYNATRIEVPLPLLLDERLHAAATERGSTFFAFLVASFETFLHRLSGQGDFVVGVSAAGQAMIGADELVGHCANVLPMRCGIAANESFDTHLAGTQGRLLEAFEHQRCSFGSLLGHKGLKRDSSRVPLVSVVLNMNPTLSHLSFAGLEVEGGSIRRRYEIFDLFFNVVVTPGDFHLECTFNTDLLDVETVERWLRHYQVILEGVAAEGSLAVGDIPLLTGEEVELLESWNATEVEYPTGTLHDLFEAQVRKSPNAVCVLSPESGVASALTYAEVEERARVLAVRLQERGVGRDVPVAVVMERSAELVVSLLAVLKAGGAYVPVDPSYPEERKRFMLEDSAAPVLLTQSHLVEQIPSAPDTTVLVMDELWPSLLGDESPRPEATPESLAYIIYTSGSTGKPKGAMIEHRSIVNRLLWMQDEYGLDASDVVLQKTPYSFDVSVWEFFWPLMAGARLVMARPEGHMDPAYLVHAINEHDVTTIHFVPSMLQAFLESPEVERCGGTLRRVICSGEALSTALRDRFFERLPEPELHNLYGPTEAAVDVTYWHCMRDSIRSTVPIGRPVANTQVHVLDVRMQPVPIGVPGELYIGGVQVGRGYLNRTELTAERFVEGPDGLGRLYRTGDLVRWAADGALEFMGRLDYQVKVRGLRIELGEVEAALEACSGVRQAVVDVREPRPGDRVLVGYLLVKPGDGDVATIREELRRSLPEYMVPSYFIELDAFPLSANGKVDRKRLPAPEGEPVEQRQYEAPVGEVEETLAEVWSQLLGVDRVGRQDRFFELGGHSLLAVTLVEQMRQRGLQADVRAIFATSTLAELAAEIGRPTAGPDVPPNLIPPDCEAITPEMLPLVSLTQAQIERIVTTVPGGAMNVQDIYPLTPLQEGILFHHVVSSQGDPYLLSQIYRFDTRERLDAFVTAFQAVIRRNDILRTAVVWEGLPEPVQVVWREASLEVEEVTLDTGANEASQEMLARFGPRRTRLDVARAPLLRGYATRDGEDDHWLLLLLQHHLIGDHTTVEVQWEEIEAHLLGESERLPAPPAFREFVAEARLAMAAEEHEVFFREMLGDVTEPTTPFGLVDVQGDGSEIEQSRLQIDAGIARGLRRRARALGVSAASLCHVAFAQVLARVTGRDDVVFGTVLFGRTRASEGIDRAMGLFMNTLPIRLRVDETGVAPSVRGAHELLGKLLQHGHASLALAQRCSGVGAAVPLFSALLNYRHSTMAAGATARAEEAWRGIERLSGQERTNYPLMLSVDDLGEGFSLTAQAPPSVGAHRICELMHRALEMLVEASAREPNAPLASLDVLPKRETALLVERNATVERTLEGASVVEGIEVWAHKRASELAVTQGQTGLTYQDLAARSDAVARTLVTRGVNRGDIVGVCFERSPAMVVALLGVWKAGGAYLPLDPDFPADRLRFMVEDSGAALVLTDGVAQTVLPEGVADILPLDQALENSPDTTPQPDEPAREDLAYVIYTSGSTGRPKGVELEHGNLLNFITSMSEQPGLDETDVLLAVTTLSFDIAGLELWLPLWQGARVEIASEEEARDGGWLAERLEETEATVMQATPATWRMLLDAGWTGRLRKILCGGEAFPRELVIPLLERADEVWNMYGPTETTVWSTAARVDGDAAAGSVPIGRPIANTQAYVVDSRGRLTPEGVPGELWISGAGVGRGYHARPDLTAQRFLVDPFAVGGRAYRTGDLVRWLPDGGLDHLGRMDNQVKVNGFRIELGEIEAVLGRHPDVRQTVVAVREATGGDARLVAYVVWQQASHPLGSELRRYLRASLPDYMIPAVVVDMDSFPLTPNGKIDRKQLPNPLESVVAREYVPPKTELERGVAAVWSELLGTEQIGLHDNFFELGGHSLLAVRAVALMEERTGIRVDPRAMFFQTLEQVVSGQPSDEGAA